MAIKNILFDLGGVILDINYQNTIDAFQRLGFRDFDKHYTQAKQAGVFDDFEEGKISSNDFVYSLKPHLPESVKNEDIIAAWNAMLLNWSTDKIDFIKSLQDKYRVFLFSNTNEIHKTHFEKTLQEQIGLKSLDELFVKAYYSHEFGHRKPHPESFKLLLDENQLIAKETLFIDDSIQHVEGAKTAGLHAIHLVNQSVLALRL
jgi:putative hydrolase of the HAD superfamily